MTKFLYSLFEVFLIYFVNSFKVLLLNYSYKNVIFYLKKNQMTFITIRYIYLMDKYNHGMRIKKKKKNDYSSHL